MYTLRGLDLVISTIGEEAQLSLVQAAALAGVRHFIPSAFSGPDQSQSEATGCEDWITLLELLKHHQINSSMGFTIFTPGVFYERFAPGGLNETMQISTVINRHRAIGEEGNFLIDMRSGKALIPVASSTEELSVCLTSVPDVARYVVAVIQTFGDTTTWPMEFRFCTERLTMSELQLICQRVRGTSKQAPRIVGCCDWRRLTSTRRCAASGNQESTSWLHSHVRERSTKWQR